MLTTSLTNANTFENDDSISNNNILFFPSSNYNSYANLIRENDVFNASTDPVIVNDDDEDDITNNISLVYKQPSYISLSDIIITKGGEVIHESSHNLNTENSKLTNLNFNDENEINEKLKKESHNKEQNPVIVFDSLECLTDSNHEICDSPISLNVRQPSYISLGPLEFIPKGSSSLSDFHPKIEETTPNQVEPIEDNDIMPEVQFVQKLKSKNSKRWKEMGYQPPKDLIPLIKAASLVKLDIKNQSSGLKNGKIYTSNSQNNLIRSNNHINDINTSKMSKLVPTNEEKDNPRLNIDCGKMRRSSSFGMEIGEAKNKHEMMNEIMSSTISLQSNIDGDDFADDEL